MAELLKVALRGEHCNASKVVSGSGGESAAYLLCDQEPDHLGPLHYDVTDRIWWAADG